MSNRDAGAIDPGQLSSHTYNMVVEAFGYKGLNFTARANISIVLTIDAEFTPSAGPEAFERGEGCIDALVMDRENYDKWLRNESSSTLFTASGAHLNTYMFQMVNGGTYYLVLSNAGKCTEKFVTVEIRETTAQIIGGQQYQVAGLSSLSLGAVLAIYGFTNEKAPAVKAGEKTGEKTSEVDESTPQVNGDSS